MAAAGHSGASDVSYSSKLVPEYIPRSSIDYGDAVAKWTNDKLKFWSNCRRLNQQGNKNEPVATVLSFNAIPHYRDNVYDSDPGKNYTKAKLQREKNTEKGLHNSQFNTDNTEPQRQPIFPPGENADELFNENFTVLPNFVPMDAFQHIKNCGKSAKRYNNVDVVINSNDKGMRMLKFGHDVQVYKKPGQSNVCVRACCWASYKRDRKYKVNLIVHEGTTKTISSASCDRECPASKSECCCHVMAVIWKLEDMTRNDELKEVDKRPCTSKPQQWGKGGKREVNLAPVMSTSIIKPRHASDQPDNRKRGVHSSFFDPRPIKQRILESAAMVKLKHDIQQINPHIPLAVMLLENDQIEKINTLVGAVAKGSTLHKQLQRFQDQAQRQSALHTANLPVGNVPLQCQDDSSKCDNHPSLNLEKSTAIVFPKLPVHCTEETIDFNLFNSAPELGSKLQLSLQSAQELQAQTVGQASNKLWKTERKYRVTASMFGKVIKRKKEPTLTFIRHCCDPRDISHLPFIKHGKANEAPAAELYVDEMHKEGNSGLKISKVGLRVNPSLPHLGASLDRVVLDPSSEDKFGGLEIKTCPKAGTMGLSASETAGHPSFKSNHFFILQNNNIVLNTKHDYYFQVQGQLGLSTLPWADFVAYPGKGDIFKQRIQFNKELWINVMLPKLNSFYFDHTVSFFLEKLNEDVE